MSERAAGGLKVNEAQQAGGATASGDIDTVSVIGRRRFQHLWRTSSLNHSDHIKLLMLLGKRRSMDSALI